MAAWILDDVSGVQVVRPAPTPEDFGIFFVFFSEHRLFFFPRGRVGSILSKAMLPQLPESVKQQTNRVRNRMCHEWEKMFFPSRARSVVHSFFRCTKPEVHLKCTVPSTMVRSFGSCFNFVPLDGQNC